MRVAVFDVSHWHFPQYLDALRDPGIEIVGISDSASFAGPKVAEQLNCRLFSSSETLLDEAFDFALVFSRHSAMAGMAERLIRRGIPFLIEKPCGLDLAEVRRIRRLADERSVYASVPFIMRVSDLASRLSPAAGLTPEGYRHLSFRFIVGPASRYEANANGWMLDKSQAGGGSTLNVGIHFIDLIASLTTERITHVCAQMRTERPDISVEEQSVFTCVTAAGQIGVVETGYLYPSTPEDQRDFAFSLSHASAYVRGYADQFQVKHRAGGAAVSTTVEYNTDVYYSAFLRRSFADVVEGRAPIAGLLQAEQAVAVVEAGYRSAARGGMTEPVDLDGQPAAAG